MIIRNLGQLYITIIIEQEQLLEEWWTEEKVTCIQVLNEYNKIWYGLKIAKNMLVLFLFQFWNIFNQLI